MTVLARDVMKTDVTTVQPETSIEDLIQLLRVSHFTAVPVVDGEGRAVGLISETDILRALAYTISPPQSGEFATQPDKPRDKGVTTRILRGGQREHQVHAHSVMKELLTRTVQDLMTPVVISCSPDDALSEVCRTFVWKEIHRVVVLDAERKVVGLISTLDLAEAYGKDLKSREG